MSPFEQGNARAIALGDLLLLFLAHLVRIIELLKKFVRVFDPIHAKVEVVDVLITRPQPRRFIRRIAFVSRQLEIRLRARDSWRFWLHRQNGRGRGARTNYVEAEDRSYQDKIDGRGYDDAAGLRRCGHDVTPF